MKKIISIDLDIPDSIKTALNKLGKTEDLSFSPDHRKLALVGYLFNRILLLDIKVSKKKDKRQIVISNYLEICSSSFKNPHGVAWINNKTIVVANRMGGAFLLALPSKSKAKDQNRVWLTPFRTLPPLTPKNTSADCVTAHAIGKGFYEILLCSNNGHYISSHLINTKQDFHVESSCILLKHKINVPDGVALSDNRAWIAISNHHSHTVFIYKNLKSLNPDTPPDAILHGLHFPHGIKFVEDTHFLFVSDAGGPFVYCYYSKTGEWSGHYQPVSKFRVMHHETFLKGHVNPQEGGVKGVAFFKNSYIMAVTCQEERLTFFDLSTIVSMHKSRSKPSKVIALSLNDYFDRTLRCMQINQNSLMRAYQYQTKQHRHEIDYLIKQHRQKLERLLSSKSWKITQPLRVINMYISRFKTFKF